MKGPRAFLKGWARRLRDREPLDLAAWKVLYDEVHDLDNARELRSTAASFGRQWADHPTGKFLLSDPWFRSNVTRILSEEELLLPRAWFSGKRVLDAGCGNGRWALGLAELGADVTCVDVNDSALDSARVALDGRGSFHRSRLEDLDALDLGTFDLVFSWGVLHHVVAFTRALDNLVSATAPSGILYLYLYGRESIPIEADLRLFRDRVRYNVLLDDRQRERFLLRKAHGDPNQIHNVHDIYAPLINRRFRFEEAEALLRDRGMLHVTRTINHPEIFVRASRVPIIESLPLAHGPHWFER